MKKLKTNLFSLSIAAIFGFLFFTTSGCVKQETSKAESVKNPVSTAPANAEIAAALKAVEKTPDAAAGYNKLAAAYIRAARASGDFALNSKAESAVGRALEIEPKNPQAMELRTSLLLTFHRFQEARDFAANLQKENPRNPFFYGVLADANVELGNYSEALEATQKMVDLKPNMASYARVALLRSLYGDAKGAIEAMTLAARIADPSDEEARAWCFVHLGNEYFKIGKFSDAEQSYDIALKVLPDYHLALVGKGRVRAAQNDYENGVKFLSQAQDRVPAADAVIALGDIHTQTGNAEKAQEQYRIAEFIEGKLGETSDRRRLALLWADHDIKLDETLETAAREHSVRKDIYTADVYAWCLYKKNRLNEAKLIMNEALRLKTKDARFFYHAGMIEKGLGNRKAAAQYLRQSLQTNPAFDFLQAEKARQALIEIQ